MPEKYDPLKSAELTTEQNYNMAAGSARSVDEKAPSLRPSQCHGNARGAGADL